MLSLRDLMKDSLWIRKSSFYIDQLINDMLSTRNSPKHQKESKKIRKRIANSIERDGFDGTLGNFCKNAWLR